MNRYFRNAPPRSARQRPCWVKMWLRWKPSLMISARQQKPLDYLARSIEFLAKADVAIFAPGWQNARGCRIEHQCAEDYGIPVMEV